MEHTFTKRIKEILQKHFKENGEEIFEKSPLLQYLNLKTKSANKGSKSRAAFAALYSMYVIIEDYLNHKFDVEGNYSKYEGARFTPLLKRAREFPFCEKIQNHSFNNRTNKEFQNKFPDNPEVIFNVNKRYWINDALLKINIDKKNFNIAKAIIEIIDEFTKTKMESFERFIQTCEEMQKLKDDDTAKIEKFIMDLLAPNVDARLFEIVSYAILKNFYHDQKIYWGFEPDEINEDNLKLFKTGRTNANDGGIDFVMKPLGRFFQVTETLDVKKYFLDIDKIERYPITFVIKTEETNKAVLKQLKANAIKIYSIEAVVEKYMDCIEEIINIPTLKERFQSAIKQGYLVQILDEVVLQSKMEFNYQEIESEE